MVYGVLKASKNKKSSSGVNEVKLEGNAENDAQVDHIIQFASPATEDSWDTDARTEGRILLHRLAAKNSIQEKQGDVNELGDSGPRVEKAKSYVISISKSANVVSKLTSFVAVDKDSREPVSGPLRKRVANFASKITSAADRKQVIRTTTQSANIPWAAGFSSGARPPPLKKMKWPKMTKASYHGAPLVSTHNQKGYGSSNQTATWPLMFQQLCRKASEAPEAPVREVSANNQKKKGARSALSVISLQKASGSWDLTDQLASLCDVSRSDLIKGCSKEIAADTAEGKLIWATALALVLLMGKYSDQKDEWEMIAEKGKKYLKKNLPGSLTLDQVLESAATAVGVQVNTGL